MELYDKKGIPIKPGDVLKVFHFVAAVHREKMYMYKQAVGVVTFNKEKYMQISHLDLGSSKDYYIFINDYILLKYEIVQGEYYKDRKKKYLKK